MDAHGLALTTTAFNPSIARSLFPSFTSSRRRTRSISFPRKSKFVVFASKDDPKLDEWDHMELKFGRMLGEDPKLTIAKIMGKKLYPEMSYLEIEKQFNKKGKALYSEVEEVPFDASGDGQPQNSKKGLNLVKPVPKDGVKFEAGNKPVVSELNLVKPVPKNGVKFEAGNKPVITELKKPSRPSGAVMAAAAKPRGSIPNVILRKPVSFKDEDIGTQNLSKLRIQPNLYFNMGKGQTKENFSDITLLKKPEPVTSSPEDEQGPSLNSNAGVSYGTEGNGLETASLIDNGANDMTLINKPKQMNPNPNLVQQQEFSGDVIPSTSGDGIEEKILGSENFSTETVDWGNSNSEESLETRDTFLSERNPPLKDGNTTGLQPLGQSDISSKEETSVNESAETKMEDSNINLSIESGLQGKPKRLDQSVKATSSFSREDAVTQNPESYGSTAELDSSPATSPIKQREDSDWTRADGLVKTEGRGEVELISSSTRGFVVSFGSLIGFLPYRNLAARWKFLAFESWLRRKGLNPSLYKQNLGTIGGFDSTNKSASFQSSLPSEIDQVEEKISPDMQLEDLLRVYDQEKLKFLASFIGQKMKVNVVLADRKSKRLVFSVRPKEKEELTEKRRGLMARLSVGDVVKCCIKKITYFGIFVEVEGVPALIHQTEVSWDATLDPSSYFKVGQIVDAKVHQLDYSVERIFLSLKEVMPDPLTEALEAVIGDQDSLDGRLEAAVADTEWNEVELLIKELQQFEGIQSVSKGRYFLSPGLAPTFQVYMASMFENQYKLLARSENKVQEVIVQTSLGKEEMKSAILTCTNRVV